MTSMIARTLDEHLSPRGVAVLVEAQHLCMIMRGAEKHGSLATTTAMTGEFKKNPSARAEFLALIGKPVPS